MKIFTLLGALGMFLYGMNIMSAGIQKAAGGKLRKLIGTMTSNPLKGVLSGLGVTALIQSSSATTVMVVGFVSAGLLTLAQAIGVIMGANIGTTMTAWIISIFGFKADVSAIAVPMMALGFLLSLSKRDKIRNISEFVIGFSLLFLGLSLMKNSVPNLSETPEVLAFIKNWSGHGFFSVLLFLLLGTILTLVLQSSSATMAITLIMISMGWIPFEMAAAMVLGENIGTTITANVAAMVGNVNARRAALAHTVFNLFGVIWALCLFNPFVKLVQWIVSFIASDTDTALVYSLSMFHTIFNVVTTCVMIWFTKQIERIVSFLIKDRNEQQSDDRIKYLDYGLVATPELALDEASKEADHFGVIMKNGLDYLTSAIQYSGDEVKFETYHKKLIKYEEVSDRIEYEIVRFLNDLDKDGLSDNSKCLLRSLIRISGELESLGDSGESISRSISHMRSYGRSLSPEHIQKLTKMTSLLSDAYEAMIYNLKNKSSITEISNAEMAEDAINAYRDECRDMELRDIDNKKDEYFETVFFINILEELEKMGDFLINISQSLVLRKA